MKDVHSLMEILKNFMGPANVPNESDFIGIYGRVSSELSAYRFSVFSTDLVSKI